MVFEIVLLNAREGAAESLRDGLRVAQTVIARAPGYRGSAFHRGIEEPNAFLLRIEWDTLEAHEQFRQSPLRAEWRGHFWASVDGTPKVTHYEVFAAH